MSDSDLAELYTQAFCFVLPSLYEGFGIPLLEAMSHNCPVISSFASCLSEIGGEACLYFDPHTQRDLLDDLAMLMSNEKLRSELIEKGKERIALFSWEKSAQQTLHILQNINKKA